MKIINMRGEEEPFSYRKVFNSARRVGASKEVAQKIAVEIEKNVYSGMKTLEIFKQVKLLLHKDNPASALKFNLKQAMRRLGPTGFPFEKYIGRIFEELGYQVKINQIIKGECVSYEIDFLGQKDTILKVGECKYRNLANSRVHTNDILINQSRFLDVKQGGKLKGNLKTILVTNTKFTKRAINYAKCKDIELLGWRYPLNLGLEKIIDQYKLYPVTILPSLNKNTKDLLIAKNIVLAKDVLVDKIQGIDKLKREAEILLG